MDRFVDYATHPDYSTYTQEQVDMAFSLALAEGPEAVDALIKLLETAGILVSQERQESAE